MKNNISISKYRENILILFLILFSFLINQYYGNKGIFPIDSFSHFDTGFGISLGEYPFRDYWVISGPFIDYLQSIFFYIFGTNWQSYILHASFVNVLVSLGVFIVLKNFRLNIYFCFIYSLLVSILAYPTSGTPFVDHHSTFFSLIGIFFFNFSYQKRGKIILDIITIFFYFCFFF